VIPAANGRSLGGGGGSSLRLQRYALADAVEGGASGILASPITYDAATGNFTFPIAAGAADFTVGTGIRWLEWTVRNALGNVDPVEVENMVRGLLRTVGPLPTELFACIALTQGGMAGPGGGLAVGLGGDGLTFHSGFSAGAWSAPQPGGGADTLQRVVGTQTGKRNGPAIMGAVGYVADGSPSAVSNSATPSGSANIQSTGAWAKIALGVGRRAVLAAPTSGVVRVGSFILDLRDIPGISDFLA
jgi:hypothetical protein